MPGLGEDGAGLEWLPLLQPLLPPAGGAELPSAGGSERPALGNLALPGGAALPAAQQFWPEQALALSTAAAGQMVLPQPEEGGESQPPRRWFAAAELWKRAHVPEEARAPALPALTAATLGGGALLPEPEGAPSPPGREGLFLAEAVLQAGNMEAAPHPLEPDDGTGAGMEMPAPSGEVLLRLLREGARPQNQPVRVTTQAPVIQVTGQNTGNTAADRMRLTQAIRDVLLEQINGSTARPGARIW